MNKNLIADLNKTLRLGIESDVTPNAENVDAEDLVRECDTVSANSIENTEEAAATNDVIENAEDQMESAEAIEDLASAVESANTTGKPLSRIEAAALTVTFAQITRKHYKDPLSLLPARESNQAYAMADLNLARESMKETAKDLYKKVIETIKIIVQKIKDFIQKFLNKYNFLRQRFGAIVKAAGEKTGSGEQFTSKVPVRYKNLVINGKLDDAIVIQSIETINRLEKSSTKSAFLFDSDERNASNDSSSHRDLFQTLTAANLESLKIIGDLIPNRGAAPANVKEYVTLPGNYYVGVELMEGGSLGYTTIGRLNIKEDDVEIINENGKKGNSKDINQTKLIDSAPIAEIKKGASKGYELVGLLALNRKKVIRERSVDTVIKSFKAQTFSDEALDSSEKDQSKLLIKFITAESKFLQNMSLYGYDVLDAVAEYFEASLKADAIDADSKEVENPKEETTA